MHDERKIGEKNWKNDRRGGPLGLNFGTRPQKMTKDWEMVKRIAHYYQIERQILSGVFSTHSREKNKYKIQLSHQNSSSFFEKLNQHKFAIAINKNPSFSTPLFPGFITIIFVKWHCNIFSIQIFIVSLECIFFVNYYIFINNFPPVQCFSICS